MRWTSTTDATRIPAAAEQWLLRDPAHNTVALTVLHRYRSGVWAEGMFAGWLSSAEEPGEEDVRGVVVHTKGYPVVLSEFPVEFVPPLAETLRGRELAAASGPVRQVEAFAEAWGREPVRRMDELLYRLGTLIDPAVPGRARPAGLDDLELMVDWYVAFVEEADAPGRDPDPRAQVRHRIDRGELIVWENEGAVVSLAGFTTPIAGMSRVGMVYTPPERRRRGYASAVTHAATEAARKAGAGEVVLFTDLANPTSNSIYQALGYRPIGDHLTLFFE